MLVNELSFHQIVGRVATKPEFIESKNGKKLLKFVLAYDSLCATDNEGSHTSFIDIAVWEKTAEIFSTLLFKGLQVMVNGEIIQRRWLDKKENKKRHTFQMNATTLQITDRNFVPEKNVEENKPASEVA